MKALLECDVSTAYTGDKHRKMTPLHIAIGRGYIPDEIISRCPDFCDLVDERRWNVLHFAMLSLNREALKVLLKEYPLIRNLINNKDVDGNTPLHVLVTFRAHLLWEIKDMVEDIKLDLSVVNNQNMSVVGLIGPSSGLLMLKQEFLKLEEPAVPYLDGIVRVRRKELSLGSGYRDEEVKKLMEKAKASHLIVAALIATVTFTAAFTLPGGMIQDGDNEGTAILSKNSAFQAFVITDAIAMVLSLSAVFTHFLMSLRMRGSTQTSEFLLIYGALSTVIAMGAMMIAFVTGTYAVLTTSLWLPILTTFIGLTFFVLMFLICRGLMWAEKWYW
ncbi:hypothetical protein EZV62_000773 [Acer yangbiense]|uniref:PGG domain-containing protein n=1 Tax=Acer yangbiense TaxID=1000413 RepID=A0A5C7ITP2_9ROSI|nr:hypothetical protein EZV62_000773 [Acer yangbiense]